MTLSKNSRFRYIDFLVIDTLSLLIAFILSYYIKFGDFSFAYSSSWLSLLVVVSLINIVICLFSNPYDGIFKRAYYEEIIKSLLLSLYNLLASSIVFYTFKIGVLYSRQTILTMYIIYWILSLIIKCLWKKLVLSKKVNLYTTNKSTLFIVCNSNSVDNAVRNALGGDFNTYVIKGVYLNDAEQLEMDTDFDVLGKSKDFTNYVLSNNIDEVLFVIDEGDIPSEICHKLIANGVSVHFCIESMIGFGAEDYDIKNVGVHKALSVDKFVFSFGQIVYLHLKRILDIIASVIGLCFLLPITLLIKLVYIISGDKYPIIYTQPRVGKNGKVIKIYKFRTMVPNADEILKDLLKEDRYLREWQANQKLTNDPRITTVGRVLRKTSIDELPQLLNVIKGDMSLVGPRPLVEGELEAHNGLKLYQQIKPGITGWWGCNGRSNIDYHERLELEYYYIKNVSVYLDFLCVLRTILTVLMRDGAE